ncbi:hypothetical protein EF918_26545, partial [Streptomyces sp. WAC06614]
MRRLTRITVPAALTLTLLAASPGLAGAAGGTPPRPVAGASAPVPGADALLAQVKSLGDVGAVLTPVTDLLGAVLKADNGKLPEADLTRLTGNVTAALDKLKSAAPLPA